MEFNVSDSGRRKGGGCSRGHGNGVLSFALYLGNSKQFEWNHFRH